jgi:hypothetical protein
MTIPAVDDYPLAYPLDILASYHYLNDTTKMAKIVNARCWRIIGDSGAFSAHTLGQTIDLADYAAWCHTWWDHLVWCASLDVIGDPVASFRNWTTLRDRHQLVTVPTVHAGAGTEWIDQYATEGADLIGLGGLVGRNMPARGYRWAVHVVRHVRDRWPDVRLHLWGIAADSYLRHLPVWSADSSGVSVNPYKFAILRLCDPRTGESTRVHLRSRKLYTYGPLLRSVYGVDPRQLSDPSPASRRLISRIAVASTVNYATWLQRHHQVTPPSTYRGPADLVGPRIHLVEWDYTNLLPTERDTSG